MAGTCIYDGDCGICTRMAGWVAAHSDCGVVSSQSLDLAEVGLTKAEVRELSAAMGLPTADKPASPCLASRFAYGVRVTHEGLRRIEQAEDIVRALGFEVFRVRDHGDLARIELPEGDIERGAALKHELATELAALGFRYVTLDLTGFRSGSMNEVLRPSFRRQPAAE
jgi:uncharacterized protein